MGYLGSTEGEGEGRECGGGEGGESVLAPPAPSPESPLGEGRPLSSPERRDTEHADAPPPHGSFPPQDAVSHNHAPTPTPSALSCATTQNPSPNPGNRIKSGRSGGNPKP